MYPPGDFEITWSSYHSRRLRPEADPPFVGATGRKLVRLRMGETIRLVTPEVNRQTTVPTETRGEQKANHRLAQIPDLLSS